LRILSVVLEKGLMKNRNWNSTEKCEWRENGEKTCAGKRCFSFEQYCAKGRANWTCHHNYSYKNSV